jgi:O-acetyl-ADP-ribose deacetylase (regulator of RNase III)
VIHHRAVRPLLARLALECDCGAMRSPRIRVVLGHTEDTTADIVLRAGTRASEDGRVVTVCAPRWQPPNGSEHLLAEAYRDAVAAANARQARTMALPAILARGPWPLEQVTRIALTVLKSTPTTVHEVVIAAGTPAMVERWAEALVREPTY